MIESSPPCIERAVLGTFLIGCKRRNPSGSCAMTLTQHSEPGATRIVMLPSRKRGWKLGRDGRYLEQLLKNPKLTGLLALIYLTRCDLYTSGLPFQHGTAIIEPRKKTPPSEQFWSQPKDELAGEPEDDRRRLLSINGERRPEKVVLCENQKLMG